MFCRKQSVRGAASREDLLYHARFRYERPQAGRLREHHQFGVELYGSYGAEMDVEAISIAKSLFVRLGLDNITLNINSIGCPTCRKEYNKALKEYYKDHIDDMCETCRERLDKNPLRILDCKEEKCKKINADAPVILDYLCDDCKKHMDDLKKGLETLEIPYVVNPRIVRGLDYYTRTVLSSCQTISARRARYAAADDTTILWKKSAANLVRRLDSEWESKG